MGIEIYFIEASGVNKIWTMVLPLWLIEVLMTIFALCGYFCNKI